MRVFVMVLVLQILYTKIKASGDVSGNGQLLSEKIDSSLIQEFRNLANSSIEKAFIKDDMHAKWYLERANLMPSEAHRLLQEVSNIIYFTNIISKDSSSVIFIVKFTSYLIKLIASISST